MQVNTDTWQKAGRCITALFSCLINNFCKFKCPSGIVLQFLVSRRALICSASVMHGLVHGMNTLYYYFLAAIFDAPVYLLLTLSV